MDVFLRKGDIRHAPSLQAFDTYRKNEVEGSTSTVAHDGSLLEYETLVSASLRARAQGNPRGGPEGGCPHRLPRDQATGNHHVYHIYPPAGAPSPFAGGTLPGLSAPS